jgi:glycosyltransferase involved in cell wall biosynthesis
MNAAKDRHGRDCPLAERPVTILQIIPELDAGGAELATIEIAGALVKAGGRALVLSEGGRLVSPLNEAGGEFMPFAAATKNPAHILWNAALIARLAKAEGVDLVHARSRAPAWSGLIAARRTGRPFVTTYHGAYSEKGRLKKAYNRVMARGDRVIANSAYTAGLIKSRYGTEDGRIRVIPRGVDAAVFDPGRVAPARVAALRQAWGVPEGAHVILQAARLTAWKGQHVLIDAVRQLDAAGRLADACVVLAGDAQGRDGYAASLAAAAKAAGLGDRVKIVGHVADMSAAFAAAHVAVIASTEPEAFGRTSAEAQAMGCPVIATAIGAPTETVLADGPERTGWLVLPADAAALAAALAEALELPAQARASLGTRARAHAMSAFSLAAMKRSTLAVYDELLGSHLAERFSATEPAVSAVPRT